MAVIPVAPTHRKYVFGDVEGDDGRELPILDLVADPTVVVFFPQQAIVSILGFEVNSWRSLFLFRSHSFDQDGRP